MHCIVRRFASTIRKGTKKVAWSSYGETGVVEEDRFRLSVRAGHGGNGLRRYNGIGGDGGDVYVVGKPNYLFRQIRQQLHNRHVVRAGSGEDAAHTKLVGLKGTDVTISVPIGVEAVNKNTNILLARCTEPFQRHMLAQGGQGGSAANDYRGSRGEALVVELHLKLRPNVGLIGLPNAGKSTLLKALVPKKRVKIASYPFTTTKPQLCFLDELEDNNVIEERYRLSVADLPGLIEGASKNRGKGFTFLKHLEYCDILLLIVDVNGFRLRPSLESPYRSPLDTVAILNAELETYNSSLVQKPAVVTINKIDLPNGEKKAEELVSLLKSRDWIKSVPEELRPKIPLQFEEVIPISAKRNQLSSLRSTLERIFNSLYPLTDVNDLEDSKSDSNCNFRIV